MERTKTPNVRAASLDLSDFVKLAYALIGSGAIAYFLAQMRNGHSLAAAAESASLGLLYAVGGLIIVFGVIVVGISLRKQ